VFAWLLSAPFSPSAVRTEQGWVPTSRPSRQRPSAPDERPQPLLRARGWANWKGQVPSRLKEWTYAGFAFDLGSALIAHLSVGDDPEAWGWAPATGVLWGLSYFFWRRLQAMPPSTLPAGG